MGMYSASGFVSNAAFHGGSFAGSSPCPMLKYSSGLPATPVLLNASHSRVLPLRDVKHTKYDARTSIRWSPSSHINRPLASRTHNEASISTEQTQARGPLPLLRDRNTRRGGRRRSVVYSPALVQ